MNSIPFLLRNGKASAIVLSFREMCIRDSNNTVTINGAVMVPNTVSYMQDKDVDYYLNQAGGYSDNAKKSKKFIVYMNCLLYTSF